MENYNYHYLDLYVFKFLDQKMEELNFGKEVLFLAGTHANLMTDDLFRGMNDIGSITYSFPDKETIKEYNYDSFRYGSFTFHKKRVRDNQDTDEIIVLDLSTGQSMKLSKLKDEMLLHQHGNELQFKMLNTVNRLEKMLNEKP